MSEDGLPDLGSPSIICETDRLVLRRQQSPDIQSLIDLWADPAVTRHLGGPRDRVELQAAFEETAEDPCAERYDVWPLVEKATGRVVGHCGLLDKEVENKPEVELVYILTPSVWGKGYATEIARAIKQFASETMGVKRLIALIEPGNVASERVAVNLRMTLENQVVRPGGGRRKVYATRAGDATES
jgi:ribosomal-protein-alanine N-acetyltransferase